LPGTFRRVECPRCHGPLILKNRTRLVSVGILLIATLALGPLAGWIWVPAGLAAVTGVYLVAWGAAGRGRWCRACKAPTF
jgi:hypothetical protein